MRMFFALVSGVFISIGLFFGMHMMISSDDNYVKENRKTPHLVYLRDKQETNIEKKKRLKPKKIPKKEPIKKLKIIKTNITPKINQNVRVKPLHTSISPKNIDISAISSLSGAQVDSSTILQATIYDANSLQVLRKVNPRYPRRAMLKKQSGFVQLSFLISKNGEVSNVIINDSNPKNTFEKAAISAIKKWKFKQSNEEKNATITFNFRLAK